METYQVRGKINITYEHEYTCEECGQLTYHSASDTVEIDKLASAESGGEAAANVLYQEFSAWQRQHGDSFVVDVFCWARGDPQVDMIKEDALMRMYGAPMLPQFKGL